MKATAERDARKAEAVRLAGLGLSPKKIGEYVGVGLSTVREYLHEYRETNGEIPMSDLHAGMDTTGLLTTRSANDETEEKVERWRNGREFADDEMGVVAVAHAANRDREWKALSLPSWRGRVA